MKITSSRRKFREYVEKHFMPGGPQQYEWGVNVSRDGRLKSIDRNRRLIMREGFHTESATSFFKYLKRRQNMLPFELVAVKSQDIPALMNSKKVYGVFSYAQRYFHRPSLESLKKYLLYKKHVSSGAEKPIRNKLNTLDDSYCMHLLRQNPNITLKEVDAIIDALKTEFYDARNDKVFDRHIDFSATNYLVFGFNKKTGRLKVGVIDI